MLDGSNVNFRRTVAGLVVREKFGGLLIHMLWPKKAAVQGDGNLSVVTGDWPEQVVREVAMRNCVRHEFGLKKGIPLPVTRLEHEPFKSRESNKVYFWLLVDLSRSTAHLSLNVQEIASDGWYDGPEAVGQALKQMHAFKGEMFRKVLSSAIREDHRLAPYHRLAISPLKSKIKKK